MRIAITGGTGFVGRHLARALVTEGHEVILIARGVDRSGLDILKTPGISFFADDLSNSSRLTQAFAACGAVAHLAGINREIGRQNYQRVHIEGTHNVTEAARRAGVGKIVLLSFLRARPNCGSPYHESKWAAEEIVRNSGLDYTVLKAGVIYGRGDHMLNHLSHALNTFPVFLLVGIAEKFMRPLAVEDLVRILRAVLVEERLSRETVAVTGPEEITISEAVHRVAKVVERQPLFLRVPVAFHYALAWILERIMTIPLASLAQVRILSEGLVEPLPIGAFLLPPFDLRPHQPFSQGQIRKGVPAFKSFGREDLLWCRRATVREGASKNLTRLN